MPALMQEIVAGLLLFAMAVGVVVALGNMAADKCDLLASQRLTQVAVVR